jgi:DNA-binding MarR family transcriptional regulator
METETILNISSTELCKDLLKLLKRFKTTLADIAESYELTTMQLATLSAINDGYTTMGKVAQTMHCDASNVTGIVDRLVALELVTRHEGIRDRRVKTLGLTGRGQEILSEIMKIMPQRLGCDQLTDEERNTLHGTLAKITVK